MMTHMVYAFVNEKPFGPNFIDLVNPEGDVTFGRLVYIYDEASFDDWTGFIRRHVKDRSMVEFSISQVRVHVDSFYFYHLLLPPSLALTHLEGTC